MLLRVVVLYPLVTSAEIGPPLGMGGYALAPIWTSLLAFNSRRQHRCRIQGARIILARQWETGVMECAPLPGA